MDHVRPGDGRDDPVRPRPQDPAVQLPELDEIDPQAMADYLTLEMDISELPGFAADIEAFSHRSEPHLPELQEPELEALDLELPELFVPEEPALPGYLTLEVDIEALPNELPGEEADDRAPRGAYGHGERRGQGRAGGASQ